MRTSRRLGFWATMTASAAIIASAVLAPADAEARLLTGSEPSLVTGAFDDLPVHTVADEVCTAYDPQGECDAAQDPFLPGPTCSGPGTCDYCATQVQAGDTIWRCGGSGDGCDEYDDPQAHGSWDCGRKANGTCTLLGGIWRCQGSATIHECSDIPKKECVSNVSTPGD